MFQAAFVEDDMTNVEMWASLMKLTQLMSAKAHVVNNHLVVQANRGDCP